MNSDPIPEDENGIKELELDIVDTRYETISRVVDNCVEKKKAKELSFTTVLDQVFLHKYFGIPIFLILMWGVFQFTFEVSSPISQLIDMTFAWLAELVTGIIGNSVLASFVANGVIGGFGAILVFFPPIFFMFLFLAYLEESGYLPRAAYIMDEVMSKVGLPGRSFLSLLLGFGCNIPSIMSTRGIRDRESRMVTILVAPLMSCSARLLVYVFIGGFFFAAYVGTVIFSMYALGILLAIVLSLVLRSVFFKGKTAPLIIELPKYHNPRIRDIFQHAWNRGKLFLEKMGKFILLGVLFVWALSSFPWGSGIENSYISMVGRWIAPIFAPLGFGWRSVVALFFGAVAKELVVGTLGVLGGISAVEMSPLSAYAFMAFTLLYVPCIGTLATIKGETNSWKWTLFTLVYELILAYGVAAMIVAIGRLIGLG